MSSSHEAVGTAPYPQQMQAMLSLISIITTKVIVGAGTVVQCVKPLPAVHSIWAPVQVLDDPLLNYLPANILGKVAEDGPSTCVPAPT